MPTVDQFQSVFKSAVRTPYTLERPSLNRILVVSDLDETGTRTLQAKVKALVGEHGADAEWRSADGKESDSVEQLLALVESSRADLVVSYRNVHSTAWRWPHSLGRHLDILTQATRAPILIVPHPLDVEAFEQSVHPPRNVMAVSGHLTEDGVLVDHALAFAGSRGTVYLAHVEDDATFERYMRTIARIPAIDTDTARRALLAQLLKEPRDYVNTVRTALAQAGYEATIHGIIESGHHVRHYRHLVKSHDIDLLILQAKDDGQDAMHGIAYPLAVELRSIPMLML